MQAKHPTNPRKASHHEPEPSNGQKAKPQAATPTAPTVIGILRPTSAVSKPVEHVRLRGCRFVNLLKHDGPQCAFVSTSGARPWSR